MPNQADPESGPSWAILPVEDDHEAADHLEPMTKMEVVEWHDALIRLRDAS